jgi:hypothetical protein
VGKPTFLWGVGFLFSKAVASALIFSASLPLHFCIVAFSKETNRGGTFFALKTCVNFLIQGAMPMKNEKGLLIELLVVVAIICNWSDRDSPVLLYRRPLLPPRGST